MDTYISPKRGKEKQAADLWAKRGRLMLVSRARLNTVRCISVRLKEKALGSLWVPCKFDKGGMGEEALEKAACAVVVPKNWTPSKESILDAQLRRQADGEISQVHSGNESQDRAGNPSRRENGGGSQPRVRHQRQPGLPLERRVLQGGHQAFAYGKANEQKRQADKVAELERLVGKLTMQLEIAKKASHYVTCLPPESDS